MLVVYAMAGMDVDVALVKMWRSVVYTMVSMDVDVVPVKERCSGL